MNFEIDCIDCKPDLTRREIESTFLMSQLAVTYLPEEEKHFQVINVMSFAFTIILKVIQNSNKLQENLTILKRNGIKLLNILCLDY